MRTISAWAEPHVDDIEADVVDGVAGPARDPEAIEQDWRRLTGALKRLAWIAAGVILTFAGMPLALIGIPLVIYGLLSGRN